MTKITTLTLNPAVDVSVAVDKVEPIHKLRCEGVERDAGGGGINVARVVRRLGGDPVAVFTAGGRIGELLSTLVHDESVRGVAVPITEETRESFSVFETASGQQYRFVLPGPRLSETEFAACLDALTELEAAPDFIVASGSLPPGVPETAYGAVAKLTKALGARLVLDSSGAALKAALAEGVYLVKPNLRELRSITDAPLENKAAWVAACRDLVESKKTEVVALTLGDRGALLVSEEGAWFAEAVSVRPVSAVGAGDSFLGALVRALCAGKDFDTALRVGVAAGSAALLTSATGLCRREDVERLVSSVHVESV